MRNFLKNIMNHLKNKLQIFIIITIECLIRVDNNKKMNIIYKNNKINIQTFISYEEIYSKI